MKRPTIEYLLLVLILLLGAYFRFTGLDWDGSYHLHPDERFLTDTTSLLKPAPDPLTYLRTSQSPMNPYNVGKGFYVYGNFPMTVTRFTAEWVNAICALFPVQPGTAAPPDVTGLTAFGCRYNFAAYDGVHLLGRFLSGLLDLATILFTFLIGRRLYDGRVGLLGALLYALAVLPIQQAHFYTMDSWAAALATITLYAAVRASNDFGGEFQNPKSKIQNRWWILFGFGLGLTVASRVNLAPLALMAGVAAAIGLARRLQGREGLERPVMVVVIQQAMGAVLVAAGVSIVTFRLAQPYAFADSQIARQAAQGSEPGFLTIALQSVVGLNPQWLSNLAEIQRLQSPDASFPPALQWTDRAPILFPLTNIVLYGMGVTAGIAAFAGLAWALWRILRGRPDWTAHALPVAWSALYFLFMGTRWVKSMRYFLPIYPTLLLLAAWAVFKIISHKFPQFPGDSRNSGNSQRQDILARSRGVLRVSAVSSLTVLVVAPSLLWANAFVQTYRQPVTRVAASGWMLDNIRSGATLLYEAGGRPQELQLPLKGYTFEPNGPPVFLTFRLPPAADDPAAPLRVTAVRFNFLSDPDNDADTERLQVSLDAAFGRPEVLTEVEATFDLRQERQEVVVDLPDVELLPNTTHTVLAAAGAGGRFVAGTSVILNEHWDDPLPVRYEGKDPFAAYVVGVEDPVLDVHGQIPITNPDSEEKRLAFLRWLDSADVVVLSSQRAVWSTPRLALTYPMTTRYYQALFSGELGFALAGQFHANYHVGPLYISDTGGRLRWGGPPEVGWPPPGDLAAEEAFSVYDHPPVWIFVKTDAYHPDKVRQVLESVDLNQVVFMNPGQATKAPSGLQLSPEDLAIQRANGSFRSVFEVDGLLSRRPAAGAVVWWAAVIVLGWLTFPISFVVFRGLSDRGYALSRILGLLWVSYFGWLT
ncbi:MAG: glycosyltransferase family 39 protein, partial [Chloroflexota bacterium]